MTQSIRTSTIGVPTERRPVTPAARPAHGVRAGTGAVVRQRQPARRRARRLAPVGALVAVAVVAAACGSGTSSASSSASAVKTTTHHGSTVTGVASAVSRTAVTVRSKRASSTVALSSTTTYREAGKAVTEPALVTGDHVRIRLVKGAATPTAAAVVIGPPSVTGVVGAVSAAGFTLTSQGGTARTVVTTPTTTYRSGKQTVSAASLHDGARARVTGQAGSSGAISATRVTILQAKAG